MVKFSDYFNSTTSTGRANVAKATYASIAALYILSRFRKSKNKNLADPHSTKPNGIANDDSQSFKCPPCDCNKSTNGDETYTADENNHGVTEAEPHAETKNHKPHDNHRQEIAVSSVGEAIIKSDDAHLENTNNIIEKFYKLNDENDNLIWWYTF